MNKKLVEGVESFKQFVLDEFNQLFEQNQKQKETFSFITKKHSELLKKHQDLTTLSLKQTAEIERLSKKLTTIGNLSKIELLEKQILAYSASHAELIKENQNLIKDNNRLRITNCKINASNSKLNHVNGELIKFLNSIGYDVKILPVEQVNTIDKELLKKMLGFKYQVEEVKPVAKEPVFNTETLKDMLVKSLGKDFHVEVIGGDENSQKVMKDLFGNSIPEKKNKRNNKRDNLGRFTSR